MSGTCPDALVIGGGPAGLMAAEILAAAGKVVWLAEAKPSPARKFLMAGKSGLNLTKNEDYPSFLRKYGEFAAWFDPMLSQFGPKECAKWAQELGQAVFTGSSGRVFPKAMKASPLLRAWLSRIDDAGVSLRSNWRWTGWQDQALCFDTPEGPQMVTPGVTVFALGGASWARLGSDGAWATIFAEQGVELTPFAPSNVGLSVIWSPFMAKHFGTPLKAIRLSAGEIQSRGEIVITQYGLEGGGLYPLSPALRRGEPLLIDMAPDRSVADLTARLGKSRGGNSLSNHLRKTANLTPQEIALLHEFGRPLPAEAATLAALIKALPITHQGARPLDEAISTAGGVPQSALTEQLMLKARPGCFCAGEMLDWDAPTGGYLLTGCLATGAWAGQGALDYLNT